MRPRIEEKKRDREVPHERDHPLEKREPEHQLGEGRILRFSR